MGSIESRWSRTTRLGNGTLPKNPVHLSRSSPIPGIFPTRCVHTSGVSSPTWIKGRYGPLYPTLEYAGRQIGLVAINAGGGAKVHFGNLQSIPPFDNEEKRRELLRRLSDIAGRTLPEQRLTTWTSFRLPTLDDGAALRQFIDILEWMILEITAS